MRQTCFFVGIALLLSGCGSEQEYQGKSMSAWITQLRDKNPSARLEATKALGLKPVPNAIAPLAAALTDPDASVRQGAASALHSIGSDAKPAVPELIKAIKDDDSEVRSTAILALTNIDPLDKSIVEPITAALTDKDDDVRRSAANALASIGALAKTALPTLNERLKAEKDPKVKAAIMEALDKINK